jgi:hypothetical protein
VSVAETETRASRRGGLHPPRRLLLLSDSAGLSPLLKQFLGGNTDLTRLDSLQEAIERGSLEAADMVVLDLPRTGSETTVVQLRHRYRGELVVLTDRSQGGSHASYGPGVTQLVRPFSAQDLGAALGLIGDAPGIPVTATVGHRGVGQSVAVAPTVTADHGFGARVSRGLASLTHGRKARRRVRLAGFSAVALVAFVAAFVLAAHDGCGPGCGALGTRLPPTPAFAPGESVGSRTPPSTGSEHAPSSIGAPVGPAGAFAGVSGGRLATTTTARRTTTTGRSAGGAPSSTTPTTQPPTTPTTQPPTTPTTQPPTTPTTDTTLLPPVT